MKDHEKRELVTRLTCLTREFADTEQLRARIAGELLPALDAAVTAERERWLMLCEQALAALVWEAGSEPALYAAQTGAAIAALRSKLGPCVHGRA